jgi:hypothetical protein
MTSIDVKTAIQNGDAEALRHLLSEKPSRANQLIHWGSKSLTHPLHFISETCCSNGTLTRGKELPLLDALIEAGADINFKGMAGQRLSST